MRATLLCSLILIGWMVQAQEVRMEKEYHQSYDSQDVRLLEIDNKYGDVIVTNWSEDSVVIHVTVNAFGKTQEIVNKEINRVNVQIRQVGSMVTAMTRFDAHKSKGFFGALLSDLEDVSKSVVGNSKLSIDYEVMVPSNIDLQINNKFGDLYIGEIEGAVRINLSHGDLKGDKIHGGLHLTHSFGRHSFNSLGEVDLVLRGANSDIKQAKSIHFESSSSEIFLGFVDELYLDNRNDKILVDKAMKVAGKGSFTDLTVKQLVSECRLNFTYGEIYLDQIIRNFEFLRIDGKNTDVNLILNQGSYIKSYIEGIENQMILPNSMLTMSKSTIEEKSLIALSGMVGNTQVQVSDLFISADQGDLIISIEETDIFTNKD